MEERVLKKGEMAYVGLALVGVGGRKPSLVGTARVL